MPILATVRSLRLMAEVFAMGNLTIAVLYLAGGAERLSGATFSLVNGYGVVPWWIPGAVLTCGAVAIMCPRTRTGGLYVCAVWYVVYGIALLLATGGAGGASVPFYPVAVYGVGASSQVLLAQSLRVIHARGLAEG